jgi:hypothetical protein
MLRIWVNPDGSLTINLAGTSLDAFHLEAANDLDKGQWRIVSEGRLRYGAEHRWLLPTNSIGSAQYFRVVRDR